MRRHLTQLLCGINFSLFKTALFDSSLLWYSETCLERPSFMLENVVFENRWFCQTGSVCMGFSDRNLMGKLVFPGRVVFLDEIVPCRFHCILFCCSLKVSQQTWSYQHSGCGWTTWPVFSSLWWSLRELSSSSSSSKVSLYLTVHHLYITCIIFHQVVPRHWKKPSCIANISNISTKLSFRVMFSITPAIKRTKGPVTLMASYLRVALSG